MPERAEAPRLTRLVERGGLLAALLLAFSLRVSGLREWWLNPDEGIYYSTLTRASLAAFWAEVGENAHPPLYYLILRVLGLFTWDFLWLRVFSLICGLAAVYAMWRVGRELGGAVAGLVAAVLVALSPGAVELSQVMRPYMLQLALLAGSLALLLRYLRVPSARALAAYLVLLCLALLTHYSSVLALGAFGALVAHDGVSRGTGREEWRRLAALHAVPALLVAGLYLLHLRPLMASALADASLEGWLSFYMVGSAREAWLAFLGFQSLLTEGRFRAPFALLLLVGLAVSAASGDRRPLVLGCGALAMALLGAAAGVYPFGAIRHATWLMAFTVPVLGWLAGRALALPRPRLAAALAVVVPLFAWGDTVGRWLGRNQAPWSPDDRILRWDGVATMSDVFDPAGRPDLVLMSAETFYLLIPFYPREREGAAFSADSTLFHFRFGERMVVASQAWRFSAGADSDATGHLTGVLDAADSAFAAVDLARDSVAVLLIGGWRAPVVGQLTELSRNEPFLLARKEVPGLVGLLVNLAGYRRAAAHAHAPGGVPHERPDTATQAAPPPTPE